MFRFDNCMNKMAISLMTALVALTLAGPVSACDRDEPPASNVITSITGINAPIDVVVDPDRGVAYVGTTNYGTNWTASTPGSVSVIDEKTNTVKATIPVGVYPFTMARDPYRGTVYVCNYLGGSISVIDEKTNTVTDTISMPTTPINFAYPHAIAVDSLRGKVYVGGAFTGDLAVIDEKTNTVTDTISLPYIDCVGLAVDPIRGTVYASEALYSNSQWSYAVMAIDERTNTLTATIPMASEAWWPTVDLVRGLVYVPNNGYIGNKVSAATTVVVIDAKTNIVKTTIPVTNGVYALGLDPVTGSLYASNSDGGVSVIDTFTDTVTDSIALGSGQWDGVGIDPFRGVIYVPNFNTNTVAVISAGGPKCLRDDWRDPFGDFFGDHSKR